MYDNAWPKYLVHGFFIVDEFEQVWERYSERTIFLLIFIRQTMKRV